VRQYKVWYHCGMVQLLTEGNGLRRGPQSAGAHSEGQLAQGVQMASLSRTKTALICGVWMELGQVAAASP